jgi:ribonucleotide reductase beta subunit family protein with ferritin-like domain
MSYVEGVLLKSQQVMNMYTRLVKAFPRSKVEIPCHLIYFQEAIHIASFTFFILNSL